jgi:outer membrane protein assembly factor BamB
MPKKIIVGLCLLFFACGAEPTPTPTKPTTLAPEVPKSAPEVNKEPPSRTEELFKFGAEGKEPGGLQDARSIAVDERSHSYVADYNTGRVQHFDAAGKFVDMFEVPPSKLTKEKSIFGMTARDGKLYLTRSGGLLIYSLADNKPEKIMEGDYPETWYHGSVSVDAEQNIYVTTDRTGRYDLIKLDNKGKKVFRKNNIDSESASVDEQGNIYLAQRYEGKVLLLNAKGEEAGQLKNPDNKEGKFSGVERVFADQQGHVWVLASNLYVLKLDGTLIAKLDLSPGRSFAVDSKGALFILNNNNTVTKYAVNLTP